ncbi:MAG: three-Cys-motif partner protein TcmP [Syntrophobacteraceae bacterium]
MGIPENYSGREQAFIKHEVMRAYLERLLMIIGQREWRICFVDSFSGPWQEGAEEPEDTSVALALDIMQQCHHRLAEQRKHVQFRALFLDKNKKSFEKLESFLDENSWDGTSAHCLHGDFHDLRNEILSWCGKNDFCFFFVDPAGWKDVAISTLQPFLMRSNSEFLINFMYDFTLRAHSQASKEEQMAGIFGRVPDVAGMLPEERESFLIHEYRRDLKACASKAEDGVPRCVHMRVLYPTVDRTLYDVVYLTRHPPGIVDFVEASEKLEQDQKRIRALAKQEKKVKTSGQTEMFSAERLIKEDKGPARQEVKNFWLTRLSRTPKQFGLVEFADMLEESGWSLDDFQKAFFELESEGKVKNLASTGQRTRQAIRYGANNNRGELLKKI